MAIALDNSATNNVNDVASTTFSFTCTGTASEGLLLVGVGGSSGLAIDSYTVTYGGKPLTYVSKASVGGAIPIDVGVWSLVNPPAGAADIVVTTNSGNDRWRTIAASFTGVDAEAPVETFDEATGTSTAVSNTITTIRANSWVVDFVGSAAQASAMTVGSGQTVIQEGTHNSGVPGRFGASYEPTTTPAATAMTWTLGTSAPWASVAVSVRAANPRMKMIGVNKIIFS